MSRAVIQVEGLGKRYRIGERERYLALRDLLANALRAPVHLLRSAVSSSKNHEPQHIWALKDVSFEVNEGEVVGIIGRNGAGKTTLLKILSRVTRPTEGNAEVRGRMGSLLEVGTGFHPELTGRENAYLSGAILGMKKKEIERKFDEIVAFAEVEKFIDTPLKHYSTGMQMRLAFAVAAHLEPEILLVDEVLAVGDTAFQRKCLGKMGDVAKQHRTILFVSHNMLAIRGIAKRCLLVHEGRIECDGDVQTVVERYLSQGREEMPNEMDTTHRDRQDELGTDLRVTRVRLHSPDGRAHIQTGGSLTLDMEAEVTRPVEGVSYGFTVYSMDGVQLFQCLNTNSQGPYPRLGPGRYRIRGIVDSIPLPPGRFFLDVGVRCEKKGLDWLSGLLLFEVEESEIVESLWLKGQDGLFRQRSRWEPPESLP
jgi:lipopolysaccharide transport system ATP-binding protein